MTQVNNETQYSYPYCTEAEQKIIDEYRIYSYEMMFFIEKLEQEGPEVERPKKPKTSLKTIIKNKRTKEQKTNFDLHNYLCRNLISLPEQCPTVSEQIQQRQQFTYVEVILTFLQNGNKIIKIQNANTLKAYTEYGECYVRHVNYKPRCRSILESIIIKQKHM